MSENLILPPLFFSNVFPGYRGLQYKVKGSWGRRLLAVAGEVTRHGPAHPYSWSITIVSLGSKESEEATEVSGKPNS